MLDPLLAGVYGGFVDAVPMGAAFNKGLTFKKGQVPVHRYLKPLFEKIESGQYFGTIAPRIIPMPMI